MHYGRCPLPDFNVVAPLLQFDQQVGIFIGLGGAAELDASRGNRRHNAGRCAGMQVQYSAVIVGRQFGHEGEDDALSSLRKMTMVVSIGFTLW